MLIKVLSPHIANLIAAGEVVERPASVVKELIENSVDAGATSISVEIESGGIKKIKISDNGTGMSSDDAGTAFLRHATSKIKEEADLDGIMTLGFRGEALASIAAVSKVELLTKMEGSENGYKVCLDAGKITYKGPVGCQNGTVITISDLFYNTPARMKFLKKDYTEAGYIEEMILRLALANTDISFRFTSDKKEKIYTYGDGNLLNAVYSLYGKDIAREMTEGTFTHESIRVTGLFSKPCLQRRNRTMQTCFINGRYVSNKTVAAAIEEAYRGEMTTGNYPVCVVKIMLPPGMVDVNVHPSKLEVKFQDEKAVFKAVYFAIKNALSSPSLPIVKKEGEASLIEEPVIENTVIPPVNIETKKPPQELTEEGPGEMPENSISSSSFLFPSFKEPGALIKEEPIKNYEPESFIKSDIKIEEITDFKIAGQVFDTYIVAWQGKNMILVDQHAAHERILYDELIKMHENKQIMPQPLLLPIIITLSPTEIAFALENVNFFEEIGFDVERMGNNDLAVRSVPTPMPEDRIKDAIVEIIENGMNNPLSPQKCLSPDRALHSVACRAALKANKTLNEKEMKLLLEKVLDLNSKTVCPHGRPTSVVIEKSYIEKLFKRT